MVQSNGHRMFLTLSKAGQFATSERATWHSSDLGSQEHRRFARFKGGAPSRQSRLRQAADPISGLKLSFGIVERLRAECGLPCCGHGWLKVGCLYKGQETWGRKAHWSNLVASSVMSVQPHLGGVCRTPICLHRATTTARKPPLKTCQYAETPIS